MFNLSAWLAAYHDAWMTRNAEQVAQLFTEDGIYHTHPFRPPYRGRREIYAYWQRATSTQEEVELRWGTPIVSEHYTAVEWWATMRDTKDGELTLSGCLLLRFSEAGLCEELREYWHLEVGSRLLPLATWGN